MITHSFLSGLSQFQYHGRIIVLSGAIIIVLSACEAGEPPAQSNNSQAIHDVEVSKIEQQMLPVTLPVPGTVVSKERLKVASRITGFIEKITVDEGDIVKPGDTLVEIDNAQIEAAIKGADAAVLAAKADLLDAKDDVKRIKKLVKLWQKMTFATQKFAGHRLKQRLQLLRQRLLQKGRIGVIHIL